MKTYTEKLAAVY